jgi:hypothetical protein
VLAQLGVEDFGIYNVVGGVIVLFSFIQGAMGSATSRFFTFDLGKADAVFKGYELNCKYSILFSILGNFI